MAAVELDQNFHPFGLGDDEGILIVDALVEERGVSADDWERNEGRSSAAALIGEEDSVNGVSEVIVQESEPINDI